MQQTAGILYLCTSAAVKPYCMGSACTPQATCDLGWSVIVQTCVGLLMQPGLLVHSARDIHSC